MKRGVLISGIILIILFFLPGCTQTDTKTNKDYNANITKIKAELINKGYTVVNIDFGRNPQGMYIISVVIDTKGNYDKETIDIHKIMFNNAIADYYAAGISDFELQTAWAFIADYQTLHDYFSGRISEQAYIHLVKKERLI